MFALKRQNFCYGGFFLFFVELLIPACQGQVGGFLKPLVAVVQANKGQLDTTASGSSLEGNKPSAATQPSSLGNTTIPSTPSVPAKTPKPSNNSAFVTLSHQNPQKELELEGQPLLLQGYMVSIPHQTGFCDATLADYTTAVKNIASNSHITTIRIWLYQSYVLNGNFQDFDAALAVAKQYNLKMIVTLVNQWGDCEPDQLITNQKNFKTLSWYQTGYRQTEDGYPLSYRDFVHQVVSRYKKDTTIAVWQLVNEAQSPVDANQTCPNETASAKALRAFTDDMVSVIKAEDSSHLINLGTRNANDCGLQNSDYTYVHQANVDLCEVHSYDVASNAMPADLLSAQQYCPNKPIFIGEIGICSALAADGSSCTHAAPSSEQLQQRSQFFQKKWQAIVKNNFAGAVVWIWGNNNIDYTVDAGDPLTSVW